MSLRAFLMLSATLVLAGCAGSTQPSSAAKAPAVRHKVAVAAIANPKADRIYLGLTVYDDAFDHDVDIPFDIDGEVARVVHEALAQSGRYDLVDMPVDPKDFASATHTWSMGWSLNSLPKPMADKLVQAAQGRGIDHIVAIIDVRQSTFGADGWGLFQHMPDCYSAYFAYFVFVINAQTGATEASTSYTGYRPVSGIYWNVNWAGLPKDKQAEVLADLKAIVDQDVPDTLKDLGVVQGTSSKFGFTSNPSCKPSNGG